MRNYLTHCGGGSCKVRNIVVVLLAVVFSFGTSLAQNKSVGGIVKDANGEPLVGVTVMVQGTSNGTNTGVDGRYSLNRVSDNAVLQFSFIGYDSQSVAIGTRTTVDIVMASSSIDIEEAVVVGYGVQKKSSLTGAISSVKSDELVKTTTPTTAGALVGKTAGITARQTDGRPGASATIQIRNMGSPLYVIDGVPCEADQFNNIDINDIESISIIKDASAAIYGLRASNGVVMVTTKAGGRESKNMVNAQFYYGFQNFMRYPKVANAAEFYEGRMQADLNTYGSTTRTMEELALWQEGKGEYASFDWQDFITRENSPVKYTNINASGGSKDINYHLGISHLDQQAMIHGFNFARTNVQANIEANITKALKVGARLNGRIEERYNVGVPGLDDYWQPYYAMFQNWPTQHAFANDNPDYVNVTRNNATGAAIFDRDITGYTDDIGRAVVINPYLEWKLPLNGLTARVSYNYSMTRDDQEQFEYTYKVYSYDKETDTYNPIWGNQNPWRRRVKNMTEAVTFQAQLNYNNTFGKNHVGAVVGVETFDRNRDNLTYNTLPTNNYIKETDGIANMQSMSTTIDELRRAGFIFRGTYDYAGKYLMEVSGRYDGSYLFRDGYRWGLFPSVSVGWRISEENFMSNLRDRWELSNLKIRASWGQTGSDGDAGVSAYAFMDAYKYGNGSAVLDGSTVTGVIYNGTPITSLSWVKSNMTNIGLDFGFFNERLSGSFEVFQRKRTGLPAKRYDVLIPDEVGFSLANENLTSDYHKGMEFEIRYRDRVGDFEYSVATNVTLARRMVGDSYKPRFGSSWNEYRNSTENRWASINWQYQTAGRFESYEDIQNYPIDNDGKGNTTMLPGDFKYKDVNGDGIISDLDLRPVGYGTGQQPYLNGGINAYMSWKGIDMSLDFSWATCQSYQMCWEVAYPFQGDGNSSAFLLNDCWHRADPTDANSEWISGKFPATRYAGNNVSFNRGSDFWYTNTYYLKLRTLEIGYTIPVNLSKKFWVEKLRVYANAYNLFSLDNLKYYGLDPEISSNSALVTPNLRTISFGINLTF